MKVAYVAGPYRGRDEFEVHDHIANARWAAIELWNKGYAVLCPHTNTANFEHYGRKYAIRDWVWLEGGLELLRRCDVLVMLPGWEYSEGSRKEMALAEELGMDIYFGVDTVPEVEKDA